MTTFVRMSRRTGLLIGVDEHTILVGRGDDWRVFGQGAVVVGWRGHDRAYRDGHGVRLRAISPPDDVDPAVAALLPPLPEGSGAIGLLSSDEFSQAARDLDVALLEAAGPRVAVLLAAGPGEADEQWTRASALTVGSAPNRCSYRCSTRGRRRGAASGGLRHVVPRRRRPIQADLGVDGDTLVDRGDRPLARWTCARWVERRGHGAV